MKIALIGYGKMGQAIEQAALGLGHTITGRFSSNNWNLDAIHAADICIEFTQPQAAVENIKKLVRLKKNVVVGTTGWYPHLNEIQMCVEEFQTGLLYSANFSLGLNIYLEILTQAAQLLNSFSDYDVAGIEYHHSLKKDAPSGTAVGITELIEKNMPRIEKLEFSSVRCGSIPGRHSLIFDSPADTITISHEARNRNGFANGAIQAADWLRGKKGCFTFTDCIQDLIKRREK